MTNVRSDTRHAVQVRMHEGEFQYRRVRIRNEFERDAARAIGRLLAGETFWLAMDAPLFRRVQRGVEKREMAP